ncbi:MAG: hypothetical protein QOE28_1673 [Solirubrobacteraceae bacterium]|nr:hypothetical protein [Solirubrobacteraceae bacterium]
MTEDSGAHPIGSGAPDDDTFSMTVLALRYPITTSPRRTSVPVRYRFGRQARGERAWSTTPESTPAQLKQLRALVESGAYDVDADRVADVIVERLMAGRALFRETSPNR